MLLCSLAGRKSSENRGTRVKGRFSAYASGGLLLVVLLQARAQQRTIKIGAFDEGAMLQPGEVTAIEAAIVADSNNLQLHLKLLGYYWSHDQRGSGSLRPKFIAQTEWLIEHDPASPVLRRVHFASTDFLPGDKTYARLVALWNRQIAGHPKELAVVHNALLSFPGMPISVSYGMQLRVEDPYEVDAVLRSALALALMIKTVQDAPTPSLSGQGLAKLATLTVQNFAEWKDAALIGTTGKALIDLGGESTPPSVKQGQVFLERAHTLDPTNNKWLYVPGSASVPTPASDELTHLSRWLDEEDLWHDRQVPLLPSPAGMTEVRWQDAWPLQYSETIGHNLRTANESSSSRASIPALYLGQEGKIGFELFVDEQGAVQRFVPISGSAEQVEELESEITNWRFHPWVVDGKPVPFYTRGLILSHTPLPAFIGDPRTGSITHRALPNNAVLVKLSDDVMSGRLLTRVDPVYPPLARAAHVSGTVVLQATISKLGSIEELTVMSGPPLLQGAAMDAVKQWRWKPYLLNGEPMPVNTTITVSFSLIKDAPGK